jgi:hypothetical protein
MNPYTYFVAVGILCWSLPWPLLLAGLGANIAIVIVRWWL